LSGGGTENGYPFKAPDRGQFGAAKPEHFDARYAGRVPAVNKKGRRCKVWVRDRRIREQ
jgi:hypothetical protein